MFRWLLQLFNKFLKYSFGRGWMNDHQSSQSSSMVVDELPELTNADLELLFTQLLEGVHQARGQQWALKYLQRMEPRITVERWLSWLTWFGDKLLLSPAPNTQLAKRLIELGELNIGEVGDAAYDIGIRLTQRNMAQQYQQKSDVITWESSITEHLLDDSDDVIWEFSIQDPLVEIPPSANDEVALNSFDVDSHFYVEDEYVVDDTSYEYTNHDVEEVLTDSLPAVEMDDHEYEPEHSLSHYDELMRTEPQIAETLDELVVRLEQSVSLVQQLASDLSDRDTHKPKSEIVVFQEVNPAESLFYQGLEQAKSGNLLAALDLYEGAIKLNPLDPQAYLYWYNQGLTLFYLQRLPEAIAAYDQTLALKPDFYQAWYNRGGILGELGDFDGAIISFEQAILIKSDYQAAWASKGLALLKLGLISEAIINYDQALSLNPEDQETWYYRGVALAVGEQYTEAISSYDQALSIKPDYHEVWIDRGVVLFNLKQWSEAIASWDQALAIQPEFYLAWYNRGVALENLGMREEAIGSYQQAITIKPDFHPAWYNQAVALFYLKRFAQSIACYDSALQIKLDYWEAWLGRGTAAASLGEEEGLSVVSPLAVYNPALNLGGYEGKLASYQEGLKYLRPDTHPEGWGRLHIAIANTYYEQGKKEYTLEYTPRDYWHQAISDYQLALSTLTPEDFPEWHLEILQSLTKVLVGLRENVTAQQLQSWGMELLEQLLNQSSRNDENRKQLALKFIGLQQLGVDIAVNNGDLVEAWELAEKGKNQCLQWLVSHQYNQINSIEYSKIQELLNPTTAIIYWHFSPASLQTFIIKDQAPSPILLFTPIRDSEATPEAVRRLLEFENWFADWQNSPTVTSNGKQSQQLAVETKLLKLQKILNIPTIMQEFEGIETIILIPHRDLYKVPLHSLFNLPNIAGFSLNMVNYKIVYLPSVQLGISSENHLNNGYSGLKFAQLPSDILGEMFAINEDVLVH